MKKYTVIGPCEVAGVQPGETVTEADLEAAGAVVWPLIGVHLEEVQAPAKTIKPDKADA